MTAYPEIVTRLAPLFSGDASGHDLQHTLRVYRTACRIAETEECNREIVALAALLHDADDVKLFHTDDYAHARRIMTEAEISADVQTEVIAAITTVSFKGTDTQKPSSIEGMIVQDADRLDAIGALGIARAFAFGGSRGRDMYDPDEAPGVDLSEAEYRARTGTTINHFHEKLFLLKDLMNTKTAREIAAHRDAVMHAFVDEFIDEWNGTR